ncbi:MAG TPA: TIM barrel protein [Clostridia bacterium]|nr:TIM barrel protein [Clostridia bacterium]
MQTTRRSFIQSSLGFAFGMSLGRTLSLAGDSSTTIPIGFQLYTLRGEFSRNVPATLKTLAQMGYKGVEFWGYGGTPKVYQNYSASELHKMLDDNNLKCCGMHVELKALAKGNFERSLENSQVLGNEYLNVAAAKELMGSEKAIAELAGILNEAAGKCRPHKTVVGYHAHPFDFEKVNGRFAWDILFSQTKPEVNMQMDVGNCLAGQGDPLAMLKKFAGRTWTIHVKEYQDKTFDSDYYKEVFRLCETSSATKWYIVEMGSAEGNGFEVPREALAKLKRLGK